MLTACPVFFTNVRVAVTMRTIIGLLAVTRLLIGEAVRLTVGDLEVAENLLTIRGSKTPLDRLVPLNPTTTTALREYNNLPERLVTSSSPTGPIFVNNRATVS